jgi:DNA-binding IclR family transcriptional regulator
LLRTLRIIEHVAGSPDGSTLARLSVELKSPKSSLLGLLRPLCGFGYVAFANGRYVLGPAAYRLGVTIMPTLSMSRIALPILRQLAEQCEETVLIATLDREAGRATYIEKIESSRSIRYTVPLGTARPLYCSAAGRVLLAHADREYIEHYLRTETFEPLTPQTLTRPAELRAMLPNIRQQGLAVTVGEVSSDVAGFAAPIFNHQGLVIAALAIGAPVGMTLYQGYGLSAAMIACIIAPLVAAIIAFREASYTSPSGQRLPFTKVIGQIWREGLGLMLQGVGLSGLTAFASLYFAARNWGHAGLVMTAFGIGFILVRVVLGGLPDKISGYRIAFWSLAVEAIGQTMLWFAPHEIVALTGALVTGLGCALIFPALGVEALKRVPPANRGSAMGAFVAFLDIAFGISGPAAGIIAAQFGYAAVYSFGAACALLGAVLVLTARNARA